MRSPVLHFATSPGGEWMVVELGDGQVVGLPERADVTAFYRGLARCEIQGEERSHPDTRRPCP